MTDRFSYDVYRYQSQATEAMHPDRLWVTARLFGLPAAPADACRYLEVGCGTAVNLVAAALHLPNSEFVGLDLAETAVREGRELAAELGLGNVRLHHASLTDWEPDGRYDYVAAHGVYSWVPEGVRDRLLGLMSAALAPAGVGYVSYNALPGCHLRRVVWDLLKFHTANVPDPTDKLVQCEQVLQFLRAAQDGRSAAPNAWVRAEAAAVLRRREPYHTFHDDLAEHNHPAYFLDFAGHAARHGLGFLAEAELPAMHDGGFPPEVAGVLAELGRRDRLVREQYRDFLNLRRFRSTLVCHAGQPVLADPDPAAVAGLWASTAAYPAGPAAGESAEYRLAGGDTATVSGPLACGVMATLAARTPERLPVADLGPDGDELRRTVLDLAGAGLVALHGRPSPAVRTPGERPATTPLARRQAAGGQPVTTLRHTTLGLTDAASLALVPLLDGTRTRAELAAALAERLPDLGGVEQVAADLEPVLADLARSGMLVA